MIYLQEKYRSRELCVFGCESKHSGCCRLYEIIQYPATLLSVRHVFSSGCFSSSTSEIHQDHPPRNVRFIWLKPNIAVERLELFINLWETCDSNLVRKLLLWVGILVMYVSPSRHTQRHYRNLRWPLSFMLYPSRYLLSVLQFDYVHSLYTKISRQCYVYSSLFLIRGSCLVHGNSPHIIVRGVLISPWPALLPNVVGRNW